MVNLAEAPARHKLEMQVGGVGTALWAIGWFTGVGLLSSVGSAAAITGFGARGGEAAWAAINKKKGK